MISVSEGFGQIFNASMIDNMMVLCAFAFNLIIVVVFIARALEQEHVESIAGYAVNFLLVPFSILWVLNLLSAYEVGRLITGMPIIVFLVYDMWYRTLTREKPTHHPNKWPRGLYIYLVLFLVGGMLLVGYAFLVSLFDGFIVLASYYGSLAAYGYYQYTYRRKRH